MNAHFNAQDSTQTNHDVAIAGCGVVGLSAALVLASAGFRVLLVGARPTQFVAGPQQQFDPRVFALSHRSQKLLHSLRVWGNLPANKFQTVQEMQVWGDAPNSAQGFLRFNASDSGVEALTWIVEQHSLLDSLVAAAQYQPRITWVNENPQSTVKQSDGWAISAAQQTFNVPLLIAADGAQSPTRKLAGLDFDLSDYGSEGVVCNFSIEKPHHGVARQWFGPDNSVLALLPLPGNYVSLVWAMPLAQSHVVVKQTPDELAMAIQNREEGKVHALYGNFTPCGYIYAFPLRHGVAPVWFDQNVALMGDAAHVVHPLAGQGLNLGLEDAAELASLLSEPKRLLAAQRLGLADEHLWLTWERRRKAGCAPVHGITDALHNLFRLNVPGASWARNQGMHMLNRLPMVKRWLSQQAMR